MTVPELRARAAQSLDTHHTAPGLIVKRFLTVDASNRISYDGLLALIRTHGTKHPRVRKVMYFVWVWRDERIRDFVLQKIADATGRWRIDDLVNKENASFFEQFFKGSTATKTRSNFERFLEDAGIFNRATQKVDFSLEDGWLSDAMSIVAASEGSELRSQMLSDPVGFLFERKLNGLIDLPVSDHPRNLAGELAVWDNLDDTRIPAVAEPVQQAIREWSPREVGSLRASGKALALDLVAMERAGKAHQDLERIAAAAIREQGLTPLSTSTIDLYFERDGSAVIMEMKSCHARNVHSQIRKGVSQLLEYRYVTQNVFSADIQLVLILETSPIGARKWLVDYLVSLRILPAWKHPAEDILITTATVPPEVAGIIHKIDS